MTVAFLFQRMINRVFIFCSIALIAACGGGGTSSTVKSSSNSSLAVNDGIGAAARFYAPAYIVREGANLYVTEVNNNTVRKIVIATGAVTTLAGKAGVAGSTDGKGAAASFLNPEGITTDGTNLYVADTTSKTIRKIDIQTAAVTTLAGKAYEVGSTDAIGEAARFDVPCDIATDGVNLYVTDIFNNTIRKIVIATAQVTTLAGTAGLGGPTSGVGKKVFDRASK